MSESRMSDNIQEQSRRVRLDKWLWAARFYKTRGLSADAIDGGKIEVNGEKDKRARLVQAGDKLRIRIGPYEHVITVKGVSERRGSAPIAQALYEEEVGAREARVRRGRKVRP